MSSSDKKFLDNDGLLSYHIKLKEALASSYATLDEVKGYSNDIGNLGIALEDLTELVEANAQHLEALTEGETDITWVLKARKAEKDSNGNIITDTYAKKTETSNKIVLSEDLGNIECVGEYGGDNTYNLVGLTIDDILQYDTIIFNNMYYYKSYDYDSVYIANPYDECSFYELTFGGSSTHDFINTCVEYTAILDADGNYITDTYAKKDEVEDLTELVDSNKASLDKIVEPTNNTWVKIAVKAAEDANGNVITDTYATKDDLVHTHLSTDLVYETDDGSTITSVGAALDDIYEQIGSIESGTVSGAKRLVNASGNNFTAGTPTQPVYFGNDGTPVACTYSLGKSVPADAVFTDTVYTLPNATTTTLGGVMVGAGISVTNGLIYMTKENITTTLGYTPLESIESITSDELATILV